jgi:tRNA(Ile)-lysidine synthase
VATGHTADDQAETVLHRLLRGTGLRGLGGIPARRPLVPGVALLRPLLGARRDEVLAFLRAAGADFREDASNADLRFTRNRIRHELLPLLAAQYNAGIVPALCRLAEQARAAQTCEESAARALLAGAERPRAGGLVVLERAALAGAPRQVVRAALRLLWEREGWPLGEVGFAALERAASVALGERTAVDLPGGVHVRKRGRVVQVERKERPQGA